ncbi:hypothetical protein SCLCIDRAFT_116632, partial [Scleroderma citrinum Foug A]
WATGQYDPLPKTQQRFSQNNWGYATNEVMESVDCLTPKQWKNILLGAQKYVGAYHPKPTMDVVVASLRHPSGRSKCFEPESE